MKVLITGAGGFIGQKLLVDMSRHKEYKLYALARRLIDIPDVVSILCDILDANKLDEVFQQYQFDTVIHLAAITSHNEIVDNKIKAFVTNLHGTINILNCFNKYCHDSQFVYASTGKVYGCTNEMPISENALVNPQNILGKSKRITEEVIDFYAVPGNKYLICRIFNIYGEKQKNNFVVPTIIRQLDDNYVQLGNIEAKRDYLYIDDLSKALQTCVVQSQTFADVDYVNVGSGQATSVSDIIHTMQYILGRSIEVKINKALFRKDETDIEYCSYAKLTQLTGWRPKYSLFEGLRKTLQAERIID